MESASAHFKQTVVDTKQYIDTRLELFKLQAVSKGASAAGNSAVALALGLLGFLFIQFASLALALFISVKTGKLYMGFLVFAGFFLLTALLLYVFRDALLRNPIMNLLASRFLSSDKTYAAPVPNEQPNPQSE